MLSTGDSEILKAWSTCMQDKNGLSIVVSDVHSKSAVLNFRWWPAAGVGEVRVTQDYKLDKGVAVWDSEVVPLLQADARLNAVTLLGELQRRCPCQWDTSALRTLQRRMRL